MVSVCERSAGFVAEGVSEDPIVRIIRDRVSNPFDVVKELTTSSRSIVLGVYDSFDEEFWCSVDD